MGNARELVKKIKIELAGGLTGCRRIVKIPGNVAGVAQFRVRSEGYQYQSDESIRLETKEFDYTHPITRQSSVSTLARL